MTKRYEELTLYKKQSDGTLEAVLPEVPSRCLSISLREMEETEVKLGMSRLESRLSNSEIESLKNLKKQRATQIRKLLKETA